MESITSFALFSNVGLILLLKVVHIGAGILWVGSSFVDLVDSIALRKTKLIFIFATVTLLTGILHIFANYSLSFYSSWGISMLLGSALGSIMWLNLVLGPKLGRNLGYANFLFAVPMLFFMEAASHLGIAVNAESDRWAAVLSLGLPLLIVELYVLMGKGPQVTNFKRALLAGIILNIVLYSIFEVMTK